MSARCIMVQGTMSGAGKSLLCTALCRIFRQDGWRVAPFKSQNMALNSGVTRDGREMGRAQIAQAEAAGAEPDVRMNPILLKPTGDTGSQVIVNGLGRGHMSGADYFAYRKNLIPEILAAYESLAAEYDILVIEGAGSPAEINLRENDIVNMGLAELVDAPVLLAGDIDRGGVFAQLYGTTALLSDAERRRVRGLLINKFRGDAELLRPGLRRLEELTGTPVLGVVPWLDVELDDEDSLAPRLRRRSARGAAGAWGAADAAGAASAANAANVAVIRLPHISNFTDFAPLDACGALGVYYVSAPERLGDPDLLILPGTKSTEADLLWLRRQGFEPAVRALAARGTPVLGVCGGYQMLGESIETAGGARLPGLGLLPCRTVFRADKTLRRVSGRVSGGVSGGGPGGGGPDGGGPDGGPDGCGPDGILDGMPVSGYEVHMGETTRRGAAAFCLLADGTGEGCRAGSVYGTYLHGLFDAAGAVPLLAGRLCARRGVPYDGSAPAEERLTFRNRQYDKLADAVRAAIDLESVYRILR